MAGQQICLKWNSFQTNIVTSFENLWEEEGLVDVTLASDGQCIRAHKVILSACSPFFRQVFQSNPCQHPVIILQDVHFSELESLLCFVYKGEVNIGQENLPALLKAAETLQIRGLSGASEQVKEKMAVPRKAPSEGSNLDVHPPAKRHRACTTSSTTPPSPSHSLPPTAPLPSSEEQQLPSPPPSTSPLALTAKTDGLLDGSSSHQHHQHHSCEAEDALPSGDDLNTACGDSVCGSGVVDDVGDEGDEDGDEDRPLAHLSLKMEPQEFEYGGDDSNSLPLALTLTLPGSSEELNLSPVLSRSRRASDCYGETTHCKGEGGGSGGGNNGFQHRRKGRLLSSCGSVARRKRRHLNNFIWRVPAVSGVALPEAGGRGEAAEQDLGAEGASSPPCKAEEGGGGGGVASEGSGSDSLLPPYSLLPHACLLPSPSILSAWAKARTPEQLSCDLMRLLFSTEERLVCNVNGKMGKRRFDAHKVLLIREVVRYHYDECSGNGGSRGGGEGTNGEGGSESGVERVPATDFEERWKGCVTRIDTANRGLKRNLVLRGRKASFLV